MSGVNVCDHEYPTGRYLQVLGLKISAIGMKFANPSVHEQNFLDLLNSHYLELQNRKGANSTVDYSSWKKNLLDVRTLVFHGPSLFYMHAVLVPGSCCFQNTITSTATTQHQPQQEAILTTAFVSGWRPGGGSAEVGGAGGCA